MPVAAPADRPTPLGALHRPVSVVAHRGASAYAPENTLPALDLAATLGADTVEVDVQATADGALVLVHDTTLTRTTDVDRVFPDRRPWRVGDLTLAQIRQLDAGSWFDPELAGTPVPTLEEALDTVRGRTALLLEAKRPTPGIADRIARTLAQAAWPADAVVVQSFDRGFVEELHAVAPHLETGWLRHRVPPAAGLGTVRGWAQHLNLHHRAVTARGLAALHDHGLQVQSWTVDEPGRMAHLVRLGVDGIITNRPDTLRGVLTGR